MHCRWGQRLGDGTSPIASPPAVTTGHGNASMGLSAPLSSAANTLTLGMLGGRSPEPVVLRDAGDGTFVPETGTPANASYSTTQWAGVGLASTGWASVIGL